MQLEVQRQAGLNIDLPTMFYLPPWVFPYILPFSVVSFPAGQILWLLINICILLVSIRTIWQIYGGSNKKIWLAWVVGFVFAPTFVALGLTGQISPFILAGVTGFLYFVNKPKTEWIAGMFASMLMIKPQVTYLLLLALIIGSIEQKRWRMLLGFFIVLSIEISMTIVIDPGIFAQYFHLIMTGLPNELASPTIGSVLRVVFGSQHIWLQYISVVPGLFWLLMYWKRAKNYDWRINTPIILLISIVTAVYAWTYDQIILLVAVIYSISELIRSKKKQAKWYLLVFFCINLIAWIFRVFLYDFWFFWLAPSLLIWYWVAQDNKTGVAFPTDSYS